MKPPRRDDAADLGGTRRRGYTEKQAKSKFTRKPGPDQGDQIFVVFCQKHSSAMLEFGRYPTEAEASRVCTLLRWAGAVANVEAVV